MTSTRSVGVIVGRFQVDQLHHGHLHLINAVSQNHKKIIILLGVSPCTPSKREPLSFRLRSDMLLSHFEYDAWGLGKKMLTILPLEDCRCDKAWSNNLDEAIRPYLDEDEEVILYGSRNSFIPSYSGRHKTLEINEYKVLGTQDSPNGTIMRDYWKQNTQSGVGFKRGILHATQNRYPTVYSTVDIAVVSTANQILLGSNSSLAQVSGIDSIEKWQFIGGFLDVSDQSLQIAAARELHEETGIQADPDKLIYLDSLQIDDWRYRKEDDKIMTHFFMLTVNRISYPKIYGRDDIAKVDWFMLHDHLEEKIIPEHLPLLKLLQASVCP